jgi:hypothetical protein
MTAMSNLLRRKARPAGSANGELDHSTDPSPAANRKPGLLPVILQQRWLFVGAGITAISGIAAYALLPVTGMVNAPSYSVASLWLTLTATVVGCHIFAATVGMARRGQERPFATLLERIDRRQVVVVGLGTLLLALNLTFFCMIKPQLGQLVAFSADPMLARLDHAMFGVDPWRLLTWFSHPVLSLIYHRGWFLWIAFVTFYVLGMPAGANKDRLLISYLMLWSFFGPLVHLAMPAAGPVFYDDLGFGNRFAELVQEPYTRGAANYLWTGYVNKTFNPAGGISAMPSLHLATMFWTLIAIRKTRWVVAGWAFTIYIFLGSVAIGWHYAVDGIVGGVGAILCYWLAGFRFGAIAERARLPRFAVASAAAEPQG